MTARPNHWHFRGGNPVPADALAGFSEAERVVLVALLLGAARLDEGRYRAADGTDFSTSAADGLIARRALYTMADGRLALTNFGRAKTAPTKTPGPRDGSKIAAAMPT